MIEEFRGINSLFDDPIKIESLYYENNSPILFWGIFNPYGPTFSLLGTSQILEQNTHVFWYQMFNPFFQDRYILGAYDESFKTNILEVVIEVFNRNGNDEFDIYKSTPSFIFQIDEYFEDLCSQIFWLVCNNVEINLEESIKDIKQTYGKPWDRASIERDRGFSVLETNEKKNDTFPSPTEKIFWEWYNLINSKDHLVPELVNMKTAWEGAIDFQKGKPLGDNAMLFKELNSELHNCKINFYGDK